MKSVYIAQQIGTEKNITNDLIWQHIKDIQLKHQKLYDQISSKNFLIKYKSAESQKDFLDQPASNYFDEELLSPIYGTLESLDNILSNNPNREEISQKLSTLRESFIKGITLEKILAYFALLEFICKFLGLPLPFETPSEFINEHFDINILIVNDASSNDRVKSTNIANESEFAE